MSWQKLFSWLLVLLMVYLAFEIFRKLLGGSLGFEELVIGLLIANLGFSFRTHSMLSGHLGWHKGKDS